MTNGSSENDRPDQCPNVFFLSKRLKPARPSSPFRSGSQLQETIQTVSPDVLWGATFEAHVSEATAEDGIFSVMAIQFDMFNANEPSQPPAPAVEVLIHRLDKFCLAHSGIWGMLSPFTFGCILRHTDAPACRSIAAEFQDNLPQAADTSVSIGIAEYPTLDYAKTQIVANALKALEHAKFLSPRALVVLDAVSLNISGDRLYDQGRLDEAVAEFNRALALDAANPNVHNSLGVCHAVMENLDQALVEFETALGLDAGEPFAFYNAGLVHKMRGDLRQALDHLLTAHRLDAALFDAAFQIGCVYNEMAQPARAEAVLKKAIAINPDSAGAHTQLGECLAALNRPEDAINAFKTAIKRNANDAAALSGLGWLYFLRGENPEIAKLFCEQSVDIEPQNGRHHFRLGRIYLTEKRLRDALNRFEAASHLGYDTAGYIDEVQAQLAEKADENEEYHPFDPGRQHCG